MIPSFVGDPWCFRVRTGTPFGYHKKFSTPWPLFLPRSKAVTSFVMRLEIPLVSILHQWRETRVT